MSVAQSLGICVPISVAARITEVPSGTVICLRRRWSGVTSFVAALGLVP